MFCHTREIMSKRNKGDGDDEGRSPKRTLVDGMKTAMEPLHGDLDRISNHMDLLSQRHFRSKCPTLVPPELAIHGFPRIVRKHLTPDEYRSGCDFLAGEVRKCDTVLEKMRMEEIAIQSSIRELEGRKRSLVNLTSEVLGLRRPLNIKWNALRSRPPLGMDFFEKAPADVIMAIMALSPNLIPVCKWTYGLYKRKKKFLDRKMSLETWSGTPKLRRLQFIPPVGWLVNLSAVVPNAAELRPVERGQEVFPPDHRILGNIQDFTFIARSVKFMLVSHDVYGDSELYLIRYSDFEYSRIESRIQSTVQYMVDTDWGCLILATARIIGVFHPCTRRRFEKVIDMPASVHTRYKQSSTSKRIYVLKETSMEEPRLYCING